MNHTVLLIILAIGGLITTAFLLWKDKRARVVLEKREQDISRRMYELSILKEIGDRIGYSLDVQQIIDIITNSLHQFLDYNAVSYMLLEPEGLVFKIHLEKSINRKFVNEIRDRMLGSLGALLDKEFDPKAVKEIISGAIITDSINDPVRSFFNIPLVINNKVVGVLTVAHTKAGLYKEEEMTLLYKIIGQASGAVTQLQNVVETEQEKINAMVKSMEDGVVMTDANFKILVINPAAKRMIGMESRKDLTIFDFVDNLGGKVDIRGRLEEAVKLKKSHSSDKFLIRDRFFQAFVFPVKTSKVLSGEDVLGGVIIFHDVTKEMELERVRQDFTSMIVHELRTPLDVIKKLSEILKKTDTKKGAEIFEKYLGMIYQNSAGMLDLVNDILDIAKIQAGKFEIHMEDGNIGSVIDNRIRFFEVAADDQKIKLNAVVASEVPKVVRFDIERIKEVLNNLLSNAIKFTKEKGDISIVAFLHKAGGNIAEELEKLKSNIPLVPGQEDMAGAPDSLVVLVSDNGIGIDKALLPELFSKFKQIQNKQYVTKIKGTGLGLAIVKGIIEGHKGKTGVVSEVGVGSTFYFMLPLTEVK